LHDGEYVLERGDVFFSGFFLSDLTVIGKINYSDVAVLVPSVSMVRSTASLLSQNGIPVFFANSIKNTLPTLLLKFLKYLSDTYALSLISEKSTERTPSPSGPGSSKSSAPSTSSSHPSSSASSSHPSSSSNKYRTKRFNINNTLFEFWNNVYLPKEHREAVFTGKREKERTFKLQLILDLFSKDTSFLDTLQGGKDNIKVSIAERERGRREACHEPN
jgi:hypothetical protein